MYNVAIAGRSAGLEAMMRSEPMDNCSPNWMSCDRHIPHTMMQIFSLKLVYPPPADDQVQVYGFMAVRDSLDPLRNYVFKRYFMCDKLYFILTKYFRSSKKYFIGFKYFMLRTKYIIEA